jgi:maltose O-acetyltransferase
MRKLFIRIIGSIYGHLQNAYYEMRYSYYRKTYAISTDFKFNGTDIRIYGDGKFEPGNHSYIGTNSTIQLNTGNKVKIGNHCQISHNVRMYTSTDIADQDFLSGKRKTKSGDIIIGDGVWIGANVFINPGVSIGNNSIIGANSVVTKDVPEKAIYSGIPAKLLRFKKFEK